MGYEHDPVHHISIHAPTKGATIISFVLQILVSYFNPRSHEGSDQCVDDSWRIDLISIHAPTKGATSPFLSHNDAVLFQSTLPRRERHIMVERSM